MSLTPRNIIVDGPDVVSQIIFATPDPSGVDASPIYQSVSCSVTINGSYFGPAGTSFENIEYIYDNVTLTPGPLTRIGIRDPLLAVEATGFDSIEVDRKTGISSYYDAGLIAGTLPEDRFIALCGLSTNDSNQAPFNPPMIFPDGIAQSDNTAGIRRNYNNTPPTDLDLGASVSFLAPSTDGTIEAGDIKLVFQIIVRMNIGFESYSETLRYEVDASSWGSPEFRDIRGSYSTVSTDSKGIEYTWSYTIG